MCFFIPTLMSERRHNKDTGQPLTEWSQRTIESGY